MFLSPARSIAAAVGLTAAIVCGAPTALGSTADRYARQISDTFDVSKYTIQQIDIPPAIRGPLALILDLGGLDTSLVLTPHSLRADDFQLVVLDGSGFTIESAPRPMTYRGDVMHLTGKGTVDGWVRASIRDGSISAIISTEAGRTYGVQPLSEAIPSAAANLHVVYDTEDVIGDYWTCGTRDDAAHVQPESHGMTKGLTGKRTCEIAIDADYPFYTKNGSSVTNTLYDVEHVMNGVEAIYENDVNVTYELTTIVVRTTSAADPYTTNTPDTLLTQFKSHWFTSMGAVQRDVAHLFSGRTWTGTTIGIAYVSAVCSSIYGYGASESKFTSNFTNRVGLTSHEIGHNFSAGHCSGSGCYIMCAGLGGCGGLVTKFGTVSKNKISSYANSKPCLGQERSPLALPFFEDFPGFIFNYDNWTYIRGPLADTASKNPPSAAYALALDASGSAAYRDDEIRSNFLQAASTSNVELSYYTEHRGVESGEELVVEYWNDNLTWVEINRITSNGVDQNNFVRHSHSMAADARHDELRVRLRAEVNQTNDDWYVDDIRVAAAAPSRPTITSLSPSSAQAVGSGTITINGSGFTGVSAVTVGSTVLVAGQYSFIDDSTVTFAAPQPTALGGQSVTVTNGAGTSNAVTLTYVQTDPPLLLAPPLGFNGTPLDWQWGAAPHDMAFLVVNFNGSTFPFSTETLLSPALMLQVLSLNAAGVGGAGWTPQTVPPGATFHVQLWFFDAGATNTGSLHATNSKATTILY